MSRVSVKVKDERIVKILHKIYSYRKTSLAVNFGNLQFSEKEALRACFRSANDQQLLNSIRKEYVIDG